MFIRYLRRVTVNNKRLLSKCKKSEKKYAHLQKPWHYEELQRKITLKAFAPSSYVLIISICLKIGMCLQVLMKFHQLLFKILRKLSIQKPL